MFFTTAFVLFLCTLVAADSSEDWSEALNGLSPEQIDEMLELLDCYDDSLGLGSGSGEGEPCGSGLYDAPAPTASGQTGTPAPVSSAPNTPSPIAEDSDYARDVKSGGAQGCYDEAHNTIKGCVCHGSCAACGFYAEPVDQDDCLSCTEGNSFEPLWQSAPLNDGVESASTGKCTSDLFVELLAEFKALSMVEKRDFLATLKELQMATPSPSPFPTLSSPTPNPTRMGNVRPVPVTPISTEETPAPTASPTALGRSSGARKTEDGHRMLVISGISLAACVLLLAGIYLAWKTCGRSAKMVTIHEPRQTLADAWSNAPDFFETSHSNSASRSGSLSGGLFMPTVSRHSLPGIHRVTTVNLDEEDLDKMQTRV